MCGNFNSTSNCDLGAFSFGFSFPWGKAQVFPLVSIKQSCGSWRLPRAVSGRGKIIPLFLEILERSWLNDFAVAVVVLLGQLGRLGVAACGYKDKEVVNLKCKLSGYLLLDASFRASFPIQIAAVTSLLGLMSLNFEDVIQSDLKIPEVAS
ncbi:hypothetical protein P3X46_031484 [Hevea brasiliensis]|uniref:Uncharacterized protein n=1 Tax=Hevea brasiliensis TaxID=3981 RepID=A0ABQ9KLT9_HEVBR|nr:uncharacterized protein LOC110634580 [Hevea brasiliensis]XP_057995057.1 uncharacterized protein LOC110634580 [Hevea brasiliensis]KAJ9140892.1 hypothetical protein P3X46_031484 [Hevea brasiliensis]